MDETTYSLAFAATFAAAPLSETLRFWIHETGIASDLVVAPPDQLLDHFREADGVFRSASVDLGVVAVRFSDVGRDAPEVRAWIDAFAAGVRGATARRAGPLVVIRCAETVERRHDQRFEEWLRDALADAPLVEFVGADEMAAQSAVTDQWSFLVSDGHVDGLASAIARRVHARRIRRRSVLAIDCEETLWSGPCSVGSPRALRLDEGARALQEFALARARQGWSLALIGRCDRRFVETAFAAHPGWALSLADFRVITVGWQPASAQIGAVARCLGVAPPDIVLLSQDRRQRVAVQADYPDLQVLSPADARRQATNPSHGVWAFDRVPVAAQRMASKNAVAATSARIEVRLADVDDHSAIVDLAARAGIVNATGTHPTTTELAWFAGQPDRTLLIAHTEPTADMTAAVRLRRVAGVTRVEDLWIDGDAAPGAVVRHILRAIGRLAVATGADRIEVACLRNRGNESLRRLLETIGGRARDHEFEVALSAALGCVEADGTCLVDSESSCARLSAEPSASHPARRASPVGASVPPPFRLPATDSERWVATVWRDVLRVERVGAHDDFFALGGDSLAAARTAARIRATFGVDYPISALYEAPTLGEQAARLTAARLEGCDPTVIATLLAEEGTTDGVRG